MIVFLRDREVKEKRLVVVFYKLLGFWVMGGLKGVLLRLRLVTVRFCLFGLCGECGRGRVVFLY